MDKDRSRSVRVVWECITGGNDNLRTRDAARWKDVDGTNEHGSLKNSVSYCGCHGLIKPAYI